MQTPSPTVRHGASLAPAQRIVTSPTPAHTVHHTGQVAPQDSDITAASVPHLPDAAEAEAAPAQVRAVLGNLNSLSHLQAFAIIQQGQQRLMELAGKLRATAQLRSAEASAASIWHLRQQIAGERVAAGVKLGGAVAAALASYGAGVAGFSLRSNVEGGKQAMGAGLDGTSQQLGNVVSSVVDTADKLWGGTAQADRARTAQREADFERNLAQQQLDATRNTFDQADRNFQAALQAFSDYFKRKEALANAAMAR